MGICEICILTETAKISRKCLPTELAKHISGRQCTICRLTRCRQPLGVRQSRPDRPANWPKEPFLFLSQQRNAPAGCASQLCSQQTATKSHHLTACPRSSAAQHPSHRFSSRAARHGLAVALALPAALVPSLACLLACMGGGAANVASGWPVSSFFPHCPRLD